MLSFLKTIRSFERSLRVARRVVFLVIASGVVGSCSNSGPSSSSGADQLATDVSQSPATAMPEVRDRPFEQAVSLLRRWGFSGQVIEVDNGKCASGNRPGKVYRQEPPVGQLTASLGEVKLYTGCFDVGFSVSAGGDIEAVLDDPAERTGVPNRFNLKAFNSLEFTVAADAGFTLESVSVNGSALAAQAGGGYRLPELTSDQTVVVVFSENPAPAPAPAPAPQQPTRLLRRCWAAIASSHPRVPSVSMKGRIRVSTSPSIQASFSFWRSMARLKPVTSLAAVTHSTTLPQTIRLMCSATDHCRGGYSGFQLALRVAD